MVFFVVLFWKVYDRKPIKNIGLVNIKKGYVDLLKGLAYGAISLTIVFAILYVSGNITLVNSFSNPHIGAFLISGIILFILVGINEEMFARGYCMTVLKQTGNMWIVVIVSSIVFALLHSLNPAMSWLSYLNLFLFGVFTAYMFIRSKNLWLSIGYHITWNYFEGNIFGFQVSGQVTKAVYNVNSVGNTILTGGKFGPEGGLIVTFILVIGFVYMWKIYKPQDRVF
jgi:membrane protease YdiL (CAAX protease family)